MKMKHIEIWPHKQNGIRTIIPEENCLRLRLGFGLGLELILGLGGGRPIFLGGNCPRTNQNVSSSHIETTRC